MKVICINNKTLGGKPIKGLTLGKIYEVIQVINGSKGKDIYMIIDDNNQWNSWHDEVLMDLIEWRKIRLNDLGI
jgi:hypothetical protein